VTSVKWKEQDTTLTSILSLQKEGEEVSIIDSEKDLATKIFWVRSARSLSERRKA
jgi:hypothetical protein